MTVLGFCVSEQNTTQATTAMTPQQWIEELRDIYQSQGLCLSEDKCNVFLTRLPIPEPSDDVVDIAQLANPEHSDVFVHSLRRTGIALLDDYIPSQYTQDCTELFQVVNREFYRRLVNRDGFGSEDRIEDEFKELFVKYRDTHRPLLDMLRTFRTLKIEVDDLYPENYNLILSQVLRMSQMELQGCWFPTVGPAQIPLKERIDAQKQILTELAPEFDQDAFFKNNPVLNQLKADEPSILPGIVMLIACLAGMFFVPRDALWGKLTFCVLIGIAILCVTGLTRKAPAVKLWERWG